MDRELIESTVNHIENGIYLVTSQGMTRHLAKALGMSQAPTARKLKRLRARLGLIP